MSFRKDLTGLYIQFSRARKLSSVSVILFHATDLVVKYGNNDHNHPDGVLNVEWAWARRHEARTNIRANYHCNCNQTTPMLATTRLKVSYSMFLKSLKIPERSAQNTIEPYEP